MSSARTSVHFASKGAVIRVQNRLALTLSAGMCLAVIVASALESTYPRMRAAIYVGGG